MKLPHYLAAVAVVVMFVGAVMVAARLAAVHPVAARPPTLSVTQPTVTYPAAPPEPPVPSSSSDGPPRSHLPAAGSAPEPPPRAASQAATRLPRAQPSTTRAASPEGDAGVDDERDVAGDDTDGAATDEARQRAREQARREMSDAVCDRFGIPRSQCASESQSQSGE